MNIQLLMNTRGSPGRPAPTLSASSSVMEPGRDVEIPDEYGLFLALLGDPWPLDTIGFLFKYGLSPINQ